MKKASEYRAHARECRSLAAGIPPGAQRDQILSMATNWEDLARERVELITRYPDLAMDGEIAEETGAPEDRPDAVGAQAVR